MGGMQRHLMQGFKGCQCEYIQTDGNCILDIGVPLDYGQTITCSFYIATLKEVRQIWSGKTDMLRTAILFSLPYLQGTVFYNSTGYENYRSGSISSTHHYGRVSIFKSATAGDSTMCYYTTGTPLYEQKIETYNSASNKGSGTSSLTQSNVSMFGDTDNEDIWMPSGSRIYFVMIDETKWLPWYLNGEYGLMRQDTGEFFGKSYGTGTLTGVIL